MHGSVADSPSFQAASWQADLAMLPELGVALPPSIAIHTDSNDSSSADSSEPMDSQLHACRNTLTDCQ